MYAPVRLKGEGEFFVSENRGTIVVLAHPLPLFFFLSALRAFSSFRSPLSKKDPIRPIGSLKRLGRPSITPLKVKPPLEDFRPEFDPFKALFSTGPKSKASSHSVREKFFSTQI